MILTGPEIYDEVRAANIMITPFNEDQLNPASYDLRLGNKYLTYKGELDAKKQPDYVEHEIGEEGVLLHPGILYLMHTDERLETDRYVTVIDGKSSIGRLGIVCHLTAGYGDPGFRGQYTLEVTCVHAVRVYAGMRFAQARFHQVLGSRVIYQGHYTDSAAYGPVASRAYLQFREDEKT